MSADKSKQAADTHERELGERGEERRKFFKATVAGLAAARLFMESSSVEARSLNEKALLPDGNQYTRKQLLNKLGLNPNTPPEAWITITCGTHAAAFKLRDRERLIKAGKLKQSDISKQQLKLAPKLKLNLDKPAPMVPGK